MRIIGGSAGGHRLAAPRGGRTRPTQERVREALFNILAARLPGLRVADLYAGTGALGLEAFSRGAGAVRLVEPDRRARAAILRNLAALRLGPPAVVVLGETAEAALKQWAGEGERFGLILADPPWDRGLSPRVREGIGRVLEPGGVVVVERPAGRDFGVLRELCLVEVRRYGGTELAFFVREEGEGG